MPSVGRMMSAVFWDQKGKCILDFLDGAATFNPAVYNAALEHLWATNKRHCPGMLIKMSSPWGVDKNVIVLGC